VLPPDKLREYRSFYKSISLIASWLSIKPYFLSQPVDLAQRSLWSKLRELFSKVVTKMLTEGFQEEIYSESQAPTGEDIDLQGFLPLKFLGNTYDFSLEPLSGAAGDQRRREKIIRFAFFACQTVWVGEEKFIYFDRSTNTFTHENITNVVTNPQLYLTQEPIVENSYTKAQLIKQPEPTAHENIFEFSPDSRERSSNMNLANDDYDEDEMFVFVLKLVFVLIFVVDFDLKIYYFVEMDYYN